MQYAQCQRCSLNHCESNTTFTLMRFKPRFYADILVGGRLRLSCGKVYVFIRELQKNNVTGGETRQQVVVSQRALRGPGFPPVTMQL